MSQVFESRELPPYGEYVCAEQLKIGHVYFRVSFLDEESVIPELIPLVYVGRNLEPGDEIEGSRLYFQSAGSYLAGIRYQDEVPDGSGDEPGFDVFPFGAAWFETTLESGGPNVFEYEKALDSLLRCSLRRKSKHQEE